MVAKILAKLAADLEHELELGAEKIQDKLATVDKFNCPYKDRELLDEIERDIAALRTKQTKLDNLARRISFGRF